MYIRLMTEEHCVTVHTTHTLSVECVQGGKNSIVVHNKITAVWV